MSDKLQFVAESAKASCAQQRQTKVCRTSGEDDANHSCFAFEVLQSRSLTLAAAVLSL